MIGRHPGSGVTMLARFVLPLIIAAGAARAAPPLETYGRLPGFEMAALSPSGDQLALVGVDGDERKLFVFDAGNQLIANPKVGDNKLRRLRWAGEDRVMLQVSQTVGLGMGFTTDKAELMSTLIMPIDGSKAWTIFDGSDVVGGTAGFFGTRLIEGRLYGYFGGRQMEVGRAGLELNNANRSLFRVDLITGKKFRMAERIAQGDFRDWIVGPTGDVAATLDFLRARGDWALRNGDRKTIASGRIADVGVELLSLGRTDKSVLNVITDEKTGASQWVEQPLAGGKAEILLADQQIRDSVVDNMSGLLIGYVVDGDVPEEHFFDKRREKIMAGTRRAFPGLSVKLMDWNDAFDKLIVRTDGPGDPQTWWRVDIKTGDAAQIGTSYPMPAHDVGPMRMYRYSAADGLAMGGVLTLPPGRDPKNLPVVVLPHGGPTARDYPAFDWWPQAFASRGYAVFQPNFRGSSGFGAAFERAGYGEWGRKMQSDISDGLAQLARDGIVDPKRACIMGASYGGYAALAGVTLQQGLYRCAVSVAGVSDVLAMYRSDVHASADDPALIRSLKEQLGSGRDIKLVSPVNFAERADAPILLIHGIDDTVVLYEQSKAMERALKRAGKPVEFVTLPGEDHRLSRGETRLAMLRAAVAFVEKHNPADSINENKPSHP